MKLRRRRYFILRVTEPVAADLPEFVRATLEDRSAPILGLVCPVRRRLIAMSARDLELALQVPSRTWIALEKIQGSSMKAQRLQDLAMRGVLLSDPPASGWEDLEEAENALQAAHWHDLAAAYHADTQWSGVDTMAHQTPVGRLRLTFDQLRWIRGDCPPHFVHRSDAGERVLLDTPSDDQLLELLHSRRTARAFVTDRALPRHALERVLHAVFGTHGTLELGTNFTVIKRTSPSGGALHPIDAYVLSIHVDGLASGLYHYESDTHSLARLESFDVSTARAVALEFTAGQTFFAQAHALVIHVARYDRNFWKYGQDGRAYKTLLLDSGHLSQTFYLTATGSGWGAFYTAAINDVDIDRRLRLRPYREAAIAINGIGIPDPGRDELSLAAEPYDAISHRGPAAAGHRSIVDQQGGDND